MATGPRRAERHARERLPATTRLPATFDAVVGAVGRIHALISQLLHFSRAEHAERAPVDCLHGAALALLCGPAEAAALRRVALNLLDNALQAMPTAGRVHGATRSLPAERGDVDRTGADAVAPVPTSKSTCGTSRIASVTWSVICKMLK